MGGTFGITRGLLEEFGRERVRDTPISEAGFVGAGLGAALAGLRPVIDLMWSSFAPYAFDPIVNQIAKVRYMFGGQTDVPLVLRMAVGAGLSAGGQHSDTLYPLFAHLPGVKVVVPAEPGDAKGLLISAIRDNNPVIFLEHVTLYRRRGPVPEEAYTVELGRGRIVSKGDDVTLVGIGETVLRAQEASATLREEGISAEVIDLRTIAPMDVEMIRTSVEKTGRLVVVDESPPRCSVASEIAAVIAESAFTALRAPIRRVTAANSPVPFAPPLERAYLPSPARVVEVVREICR